MPDAVDSTTDVAASSVTRRRPSPAAFFPEIFDGGHELRYDLAFAWLERRGVGQARSGTITS